MLEAAAARSVPDSGDHRAGRVADPAVSLFLPGNNWLTGGLLRSVRRCAAAVPDPPAGSAGGALQLHAEAEREAAGKVCQCECSQ